MNIDKFRYVLSVVLLAAVSSAGVWGWTGFGAMPFGVANAQAVPTGPGVAIKGWVAGPDGRPVVGAKLRSPILRIRGHVATTGVDGEFTITAEEIPSYAFPLQVEAPDLAPKVFTIQIGSPPPTTPPLDPSIPGRTAYLMETTEEISPTLSLNRGSIVTGRIVRDGKPVPGATLGLWGLDAFLESPEVKADSDGRFRFPHAPVNSPGWVYVATGSLERAGAVPPRPLRTAGEGASIDLGDIAVEPGRTLSGRVVFADGKPLPPNAEVHVSADHAGGLLRAKPDPSGHFTLTGLPAGLISIAVLFPDDQFYAPAGYRLSARNRCRDPLNPYLLMGRVDRDVPDLTILFEPGPQPPPSHDATIMAAYKAAQAGPVTGVPPMPDEPSRPATGNKGTTR